MDVYVLDGNGNPCPNQTVTFRYVYEKIDVKTDENGIAGFEGIRINQYFHLSFPFQSTP